MNCLTLILLRLTAVQLSAFWLLRIYEWQPKKKECLRCIIKDYLPKYPWNNVHLPLVADLLHWAEKESKRINTQLGESTGYPNSVPCF
jgi:hypothetical protein